jgi:hypothetical protein
VSPIAERDANAGYEVISWLGVLASAGAPLHVENHLSEFRQGRCRQQFRHRIYDQGGQDLYRTEYQRQADANCRHQGGMGKSKSVSFVIQPVSPHIGRKSSAPPCAIPWATTSFRQQ